VSLPALKPDPAYLEAFATIMSRLGRALASGARSGPVKVCVAGGAAFHFYTGARMSRDIDARVMARVLLDPADLQVAYRDVDGHARLLYFDTQYNDSFALLHADAYDAARPVALDGVDSEVIDVRLLTPLDLAVEPNRGDRRASPRGGGAARLRRKSPADSKYDRHRDALGYEGSRWKAGQEGLPTLNGVNHDTDKKCPARYRI